MTFRLNSYGFNLMDSTGYTAYAWDFGDDHAFRMSIVQIPPVSLTGIILGHSFPQTGHLRVPTNATRTLRTNGAVLYSLL